MAKIVAFDFFDTIVHRDCNPEVVIYEWSRQMASYIRFSTSSHNIYHLRKNIEIREKSISNREEISYAQLIDTLADSLHGLIHEISKAEFYDKAFSTEVDSELRHLYLDDTNCKLLREYAKTGPVVLISDFYCNKIFFKEVLKSLDLEAFISEIYVSSEIGKRKSTGNLYQYVLKDTNASPSELLMYGDNYQSDVKEPKSIGIQAVHLPYKGKNEMLGTKQINRHIARARTKDLFSGYAPVVLLFLDRLYKEAVRQETSVLLFCAREGQNLLYLFNEFQRKLYPEHIIKTQYFYVSRRATLLPSLMNMENETFNNIIRQYKELPVSDFLFSIGFSKEETIDICNNANIDLRDYITDSDNYKLIDLLRNNEYFIRMYDAKRIEANALFKRYLGQLIGESKHVYMVDIGWKGTIQDNIKSAIGNDYKVTGFYFGLNEDALRTEDNRKFGLMFDAYHRTCYTDILSYNCVHLERVFAANHGQTLGYVQSGANVEPILSDDMRDVDIYKYVAEYQRLMNATVIELIDLFAISSVEPEDLERKIMKEYLAFLMKTVPYNYKVFLNFRTKVKENFGNVSHAKVKEEKSVAKDKEDKRSFLYVDYAYHLLDRLHMRIGYPIASIYCNLAYRIKEKAIK